jgi:hypothetical protein
VSNKEYEDFYVKEKGIERPSVEWWSSTYDALEDRECAIDDSMLELLLEERTPGSLEKTIHEMIGKSA